MTFNIGNQNGGIINNVGGDQTIHGGQQGESVSAPQARQAAHDLRAAVEGFGGPDDSARRRARELDTELRSERPDRSRIATLLDALARAISAAGGWARAGAVVVRPMRLIATWLGALGVPILGLLPALT